MYLKKLNLVDLNLSMALYPIILKDFSKRKEQVKECCLAQIVYLIKAQQIDF